jgi:hypothetical protein
MKKLTSSSWAVRCLLVLTFAAPLLAFITPFRGGESFEIYLGKTRLVQQFLHMDKSTKTIDLSSAAAHEVLKVSYNHCGQTGTSRTLLLKDNTTVLKQWKFADIKEGASPNMVISVTDIQTVQKAHKGKQLSLYYTSALLKEGKILATISQRDASASIR